MVTDMPSLALHIAVFNETHGAESSPAIGLKLSTTG